MDPRPTAPPLTVAAVVLAAGAGSRFEGPQHKLRAELEGVAVLRRAVDAAVASGIGPVFVVTGAEDLSDLLSPGVTEVRAADWSAGQSHSLAAAVAAVSGLRVEAMVVGLGDMPLVGAEVWRTVAGTPGEVVVATYRGRRRPPVKLARSVWDELGPDGDEGARALMARRPELVREVAVDGGDLDVDTLADLSRLETSAPRPVTDRDRVVDLLGREPRCGFEVVVRSDSGDPVVIRNAPLLDDGTPMPTRYYLVDRDLVRRVGTLEAAGGVRRAEAEVDPEALARCHDGYATERDAALPADWKGPRPSGGVGGTRRGVKCLHAHYAHHLAGGDDPVGAWVAARLDDEVQR